MRLLVLAMAAVTGALFVLSLSAPAVATKGLPTAGFITWEQFKPVFELKLREDEDERELREAFRVLDKGNKGVIPVKDLRWLLRSLGDDLTDDEIKAMILETDTDGSGTVDYEEFRNLMNSN